MADHPDVSGLTGTGVREDEGQHLQSVYAHARIYGGAGRFALRAAAHLTETSPLVTDANRDRMWAAWEPYWDLSRSLLIEKSPPNLIMGRFLQAMFPGSAFVVVVRHPIVVALSTQKWRHAASRRWRNHASLEDMVEHWLHAHRVLLDDLPRLNRVHIVRYEELAAHPDQELRGVQQLLGLTTPFSGRSLQANRSGEYEAIWAEMARGSLRQRRARRRLEARLGDAIERFGYRVDDLQYAPDWRFE